jgi:hypothetical protein
MLFSFLLEDAVSALETPTPLKQNSPTIETLGIEPRMHIALSPALESPCTPSWVFHRTTTSGPRNAPHFCELFRHLKLNLSNALSRTLLSSSVCIEEKPFRKKNAETP